MTYKLTPELVIAVGRYLCKKHGATIADKDDSALMKVLGTALDAIGVLDKEAFLARYGTTIGTSIFLPFKLGATGKGAPSLAVQVGVLWHELHHVRQFQKDPAVYFARYLSSSAKRAWYEARAMHVSMEAAWFLTGKIDPPGIYAIQLQAYGCKPGDIRAVEKHLKIAASAVRLGKLHNRISKDGIAYLRRASRRAAR